MIIGFTIDAIALPAKLRYRATLRGAGGRAEWRHLISENGRVGATSGRRLGLPGAVHVAGVGKGRGHWAAYGSRRP